MRHRAIGDALQLRAVFGLHVRPQHVLRLIAEELPVLLFLVGHLERDRLQGVADLGGQQVAVLISDVRRTALEMHPDPAVLVGAARGVFEAEIGLRFAGG